MSALMAGLPRASPILSSAAIAAKRTSHSSSLVASISRSTHSATPMSERDDGMLANILALVIEHGGEPLDGRLAHLDQSLGRGVLELFIPELGEQRVQHPLILDPAQDLDDEFADLVLPQGLE